MIESYRKNIAFFSDSYKYSHWKQYPPKTEKVYSYMESRGGAFEDIVVFGHTYYVKNFLTGNVLDPTYFHNIVKPVLEAHLGPDVVNTLGFERLISKHKGKLPVKIWALPEGTVIPIRTPQLAIENVDPEFFWLTNFLETLLSNIWYTSTIASNSFACRKFLRHSLDMTCDHPDSIREAILNTRLHDFGMRGTSSPETAALGGMSHLLNFDGTDTVSALFLIHDLYKREYSPKPHGISIPASEHSTITSWGEENEREAFRNMLKQFPKGFVACVSDSFDIKRAVSEYWGKDLKQEILSREGTLVIRPDSGDPKTTILKLLNILDAAFGSTVNSKGYKVLASQVRLIQGDGIDAQSLKDITGKIISEGWALENLAFGSGGGLLQKFDRDTAKYAIKCSAVTVNNQIIDVKKSPKEWNSSGEYVDSFKYSKSGKFENLDLIFQNGKYLGPEETFSDLQSRVRSHA